MFDKKEYMRKYYYGHKEQMDACRKEYYEKHKKEASQYIKEYYRNRKEKYVNILGSKCQICGYNKNIKVLEFHHINPKDKENKRESMFKSFEKKIREGKVILLCANCHKEIHYKIEDVP